MTVRFILIIVWNKCHPHCSVHIPQFIGQFNSGLHFNISGLGLWWRLWLSTVLICLLVDIHAHLDLGCTLGEAQGKFMFVFDESQQSTKMPASGCKV